MLSNCVLTGRERLEAAEEAVQGGADKLAALLREKGSLEERLQHSQHELAAAQATAAAAGQEKDGDLQALAAQLKVQLPSCYSQCTSLDCPC